MAELVQAPSRQQELYWHQLFQLKTDVVYIRQYWDATGRKLQIFSVLRAVASSGSIAGWAIWHDAALLWGIIIAASQVADALRDALPFGALHRAASVHFTMMVSILVDALLEWEEVAAGEIPARDITMKRHRLMRLQHEAESKNFPGGLVADRKGFVLARAEAAAYFRSRFGREVARAAHR